MSLEEIRELIELVKATGVAELEVQRGENRVRIRQHFGANHEANLEAPPRAAAAVSSPPPSDANYPVAQAAGAAPAGDTVLVKSPIVGTYYDCPSPGAPPFVKVGDTVEKGQVLCIIESMKLMNEIEADMAGVVAGKLMENGRPVEYGEALFTIRPR